MTQTEKLVWAWSFVIMANITVSHAERTIFFGILIGLQFLMGIIFMISYFEENDNERG